MSTASSTSIAVLPSNSPPEPVEAAPFREFAWDAFTSTPSEQPQNSSEATPRLCEQRPTELTEWVVEHDQLHRSSFKGRRTRHAKSDGEVERVYNDFAAGDRQFQFDMGCYERHCGLVALHRNELLHYNWHFDHFHPNQADLQQQFEGGQYRRLRKEKAKRVTKFLDIADRRGHMFRDTYSPSEYDPLAISQRNPPALSLPARAWRHDVMSYLPDETNRMKDIRPGEFEVPAGSKRTFLTQPQNRLIPLGRHGTTCERWENMVQRYVDAPSNVRSQCRRTQARNCSNGYLSSLTSESART